MEERVAQLESTVAMLTRCVVALYHMDGAPPLPAELHRYLNRRGLERNMARIKIMGDDDQ